jgi:hypothetical protein
MQSLTDTSTTSATLSSTDGNFISEETGKPYSYSTAVYHGSVATMTSGLPEICNLLPYLGRPLTKPRLALRRLEVVAGV